MISTKQAIHVTSQGSKYSKEIKHQLIGNYMVIGNIKKTAKELNIPEKTASGWVHSEWGQALLAELSVEHSTELDATYREIITKANVQVIDRIEKGDYLLDRTNEMIRKPIDGKALATIGAITFDKRQILNNMPTSITNNVNNSALTKLQDQFKAISGQSKVIEGEVISKETS